MIFFVITLFLSGLTAIPAETELAFLSRCFPIDTDIGLWIEKVYLGVFNTNKDYPFIAYGYDWLAFAHFILAILFIGPYRDPVKNIWVIQFGMSACVLIFPLTMIAGPYRDIPIGWQLIDCSFGLVGFIPLSVCYIKIKRISENRSN